MSCVKFSPSRALLASCSWDKTVRLWDVFEKKGNFETFHVNTLGLFVYERKMERRVMKITTTFPLHCILFLATSLSFRPDGEELAVTTLNGEISFWDVSRYVLAQCS